MNDTYIAQWYEKKDFRIGIYVLSRLKWLLKIQKPIVTNHVRLLYCNYIVITIVYAKQIDSHKTRFVHFMVFTYLNLRNSLFTKKCHYHYPRVQYSFITEKTNFDIGLNYLVMIIGCAPFHSKTKDRLSHRKL